MNERLVRYVDEVKVLNRFGRMVTVERAVLYGGANLVPDGDGGLGFRLENESDDNWELTRAQTLELVLLLTRWLATGSFMGGEER